MSQEETNALLGSMKAAFEFDISRASDAGTLHEYAREIQADDLLDAEEKTDLARTIALRFSALNLAAVGTPKPRW